MNMVQELALLYCNADEETQKKVRELLGIKDPEEKSDDSACERN